MRKEKKLKDLNKYSLHKLQDFESLAYNMYIVHFSIVIRQQIEFNLTVKSTIDDS